jgi:hypothetical protein
MKPVVRVAFAHFWSNFTPDLFKARFPYVCERYDLVVSREPEIVFFSVWAPKLRPDVVEKISPGDYVRVFITGEPGEVIPMEDCEFAISYSRMINHPNHLRLPTWVYEARNLGYTPDMLVKSADTDWEKIAAEKTAYCNFVYRHHRAFRNRVFFAFNAQKRVDAAGLCMNNMGGWRVPDTPYWQIAKLDFLKRYKFTLAIENSLWPGYATEKLVDPMFANSIPIYIGDPMIRDSFNQDAFVDFNRFTTMKEMISFVRKVDNNRVLYLKMLAAPFYPDNKVPECARDATILAFFERIFASARERKAER